MKNYKLKSYWFHEINSNVRVWYGPYRAYNVYQAFREMLSAKGFGDESWRKAKRYWEHRMLKPLI